MAKKKAKVKAKRAASSGCTSKTFTRMAKKKAASFTTKGCKGKKKKKK